MKKYFAFLIAICFLISCNKEEVITEVTFTCSISEFLITTQEFGALKSQKNVTLDFVHKYPSGTAKSG